MTMENSMAHTDMSEMKSEDYRDAHPKHQGIKQDPDVADHRLEEDIYEDAGDLDFNNAGQAVYLTRIPKYLWKTWLSLEDDAEIQMGTMSLLLQNIPINDTVPREYNMQITNHASANTFVFTEKDFPGFSQRASNVIRQGQDQTSQPFSQTAPRLPLSDRAKINTSKIDKGKRLYSQQRKAIPKKTAFVGQVQTEINCLPVENDQYRKVMDERARAELKPKRETQFLGKSSGGGSSLNPGTLGSAGTFNSFIKPAGAQRTKGQDVKAVRMPQNELLDLIYKCFERYTYWPMKSLKAELNQPEAYLKQTLEMVARMVRQGPHNGTWQLKPDSNISAYAEARTLDQANLQAPDAGPGYDGTSDLGEGLLSDEEDGTKMEDVM